MDEILNLIESVSEGFPSYSFQYGTFKISQKFKTKREYHKQEGRNCVSDVSELRPPVQFFAQNTRSILIMHS